MQLAFDEFKERFHNSPDQLSQDIQGLDRCATRATGPDQVASSISTAWAALTADVPVLHGAPLQKFRISIIESRSETPMQDLPEDIADVIHVACVWLERKAFAGGSVLSKR